MYTVIRHTHTGCRQPYIIYITTHNDMHLPEIYTHAHRQSWVNRVQFLLLLGSNNGSSITGLTSQTVPREREREGDEKREGERKEADRKIEGAEC